ncbi:hypothetical protein EFB14_32530 [Rhizobium fabae]|uniref:Uncharacterized protein n=2 Tax=Rhizobium fabae TaxID=573179 RepID=A0ABY0AZJ3_9HYPH|nr:hypothetical protein EFB14_32530 [Rhizobium fabae]
MKLLFLASVEDDKMKNLEKDDLFEVWLIHMDDAIQNLIDSLPNELGSRLDYSPESLDSLEAWG